MTDRYDRLNDYIDALLKDRSPKEVAAEDAEERDVLAMAARLRILQPAAPVPRPRFQARIRRLMARAINPRPALPRRRLLFGGAGTAAAGLLAGLGVSLGLRNAGVRLTPSIVGRAAAPALSGWSAVGRMQDLPRGGALAFTAGGLSGYVMRDGDQLSALSAICNHLGCRVQWQPERKQFLCPCDDAEFDSTGLYLQENYAAAPPVALPPLTRLAVRVESDTVFVKIV
jgi:cytochrome b6-f complex iron-sulfur subunit